MPWPSLGEVVVIEKDSAGNLMHGHSPLMRNTYNTLALVAVKRRGHGHGPLMRNTVLRISCKDSANEKYRLSACADNRALLRDEKRMSFTPVN